MNTTNNHIPTYVQCYLEEGQPLRKQNKDCLALIKPMVSEKYYKAIIEWIEDDQNGIWGEFKIVTEPKGQWQEEQDCQDYWKVLKGEFIGYEWDDYSGYATIKLPNDKYLQVCYQL